MIEKIKELQPNESVVIEGKKKEIKELTNELPANYLVTKISYDKCVVVMVEDAESFTQQLYNNLESIKPFEKKEFEFDSIEYARTLVSTYNKKNDRSFKVTTRGGVTRIYEPFEDIKEIDPMYESDWLEAFRVQLNNKML